MPEETRSPQRLGSTLPTMVLSGTNRALISGGVAGIAEAVVTMPFEVRSFFFS